MIKVNGVDIPTPSDYMVSVLDISKAERNANGTMIIERVATKRRLEMTWNYLSQVDLSALLTRISPTFFEVEYIDSQTGTVRTGTFYAGDRNAGAIDYQNGVMRFKDISFNLIER